MDIRTIRRPFHLILDWDGTLTKKDTLHLVGLIGYQHKERHPPSSTVTPWQDIVDGYLSDFSSHQSQYTPKPAERKTLAQERAWLSSLTSIENRSVQRVERSNLFRGVRQSDVEKTAQWAVSQADESGRLQLRDGWRDLFARSQDSASSSPALASKISILSVNWSAAFIRQSLLASLDQDSSSKEKGEQLVSRISDLDIRANEIAGLDSASGSDGSLSKNDASGIRTSADKLANMPAHIRGRLDDSSSKPNESREETIIYVGDSSTDLECLLAADIGICVRDEPMGSGQRELAQTLERIGVMVKKLGEEAAEAEAENRKMVFWVRGLDEIAAMLPSS